MNLRKFLSAAAGDAKSIVDPRTYLRAGSMAIHHPIAFGEDVGQSYVDLAEHPIRTFENHPLLTALQIAPAAGLAGKFAAAGAETSTAARLASYIADGGKDHLRLIKEEGRNTFYPGDEHSVAQLIRDQLAKRKQPKDTGLAEAMYPHLNDPETIARFKANEDRFNAMSPEDQAAGYKRAEQIMLQEKYDLLSTDEERAQFMKDHNAAHVGDLDKRSQMQDLINNAHTGNQRGVPAEFGEHNLPTFYETQFGVGGDFSRLPDGVPPEYIAHFHDQMNQIQKALDGMQKPPVHVDPHPEVQAELDKLLHEHQQGAYEAGPDMRVGLKTDANFYQLDPASKKLILKKMLPMTKDHQVGFLDFLEAATKGGDTFAPYMGQMEGVAPHIELPWHMGDSPHGDVFTPNGETNLRANGLHDTEIRRLLDTMAAIRRMR